MTQDPERALANCLKAIEEGKLTLEECRQLYPGQWTELQRLLILAETLRQAPRVSPSLAFRRHARQQMLHRISLEQPRRQETKATTAPRGLKPLFIFRELRPSLQWVFIFLVILSMVTGVGVASASGDILPGDLLYPVESGIENIQLLMTHDPSRKAELQIELAQERVGEMKQLAQESRFEDISQAVMHYETHLDGANISLRELVLKGDQRAGEIGAIFEEALLYDSLILTGIQQSIPEEIRPHIEAAIGATRANKSIAGQWVRLFNDQYTHIPNESSPSSVDMPLPTGIDCWPTDLGIDPPQGIPFCEEGQTPAPLAKDLPYFCWHPAMGSVGKEPSD